MLKERVISALIGLPILLGLLIYGDRPVLTLFFCICVGLSIIENSGIMMPALWKRALVAQPKDFSKEYLWMWQAVAIFSGMAMFYVSTLTNYESGRGGIVTVISFLMLVGVFFHKEIEMSIMQLLGLIVSICYGCLPWLAVWDLSLLGAHSRYLLLALVIVMCNDTGGYFGGIKFGKHKLAPNLSPKKTWEGAVSGILSGIVGALVLNLVFLNHLGTPLLMVVAAVAAGVTGILGDLIESGFKRFGGVKDSGNIIPGHGGFLDRVDSLLFAAPTLWLVLYINKLVFPL